MVCYILNLGLISYEEAYRIQREIHERRLRGEIPDTLLLLEHYPVITIGKSGHLENLLVSLEKLKMEGISLFFTDRGGDITYHGPGQLVLYPIIDLKGRGRDIKRYIFEIEESIIRTLKEFGVCAKREEHRGVWVENNQIAAVGIAVKKWVTMHGASINVNPSLNHFSFINPCGLKERGVTSLAQILSKPFSISQVIPIFLSHFSEIFDFYLEEKEWRYEGKTSKLV